MCTRMTLRRITKWGSLLKQATDACLAEAALRTKDLGGKLGTEAFADRVIGKME